jgi:hypothetical protein
VLLKSKQNSASPSENCSNGFLARFKFPLKRGSQNLTQTENIRLIPKTPFRDYAGNVRLSVKQKYSRRLLYALICRPTILTSAIRANEDSSV